MTDQTSQGSLRGKQRVLTAALELFASQGFDRTTTRDIGNAAGFTSPALYRHYASKDALGLDLYRRCYASMVGSVRQIAATHAAPLDRLAAYPSTLCRLYEKTPTAVLFVDEHQLRFWPLLRDEFLPDTLSNMVTRWIEQGRRDGTVRADVDSSALVALVMGLPSQWYAMRRARVAPADSAAADLPILVRAALGRPQ